MTSVGLHTKTRCASLCWSRWCITQRLIGLLGAFVSILCYFENWCNKMLFADLSLCISGFTRWMEQRCNKLYCVPSFRFFYNKLIAQYSHHIQGSGESRGCVNQILSINDRLFFNNDGKILNALSHQWGTDAHHHELTHVSTSGHATVLSSQCWHVSKQHLVSANVLSLLFSVMRSVYVV